MVELVVGADGRAGGGFGDHVDPQDGPDQPLPGGEKLQPRGEEPVCQVGLGWLNFNLGSFRKSYQDVDIIIKSFD